MWEFLLVAAAGTGYLARCLGKRPALPREEEQPTENEVWNCYDDNSGSVELASELGLKIPTQIFNGEGFQIRGGTKIVPYVSPRSEQGSGDVSAPFISSHDGLIRPVMPSSWKGKAKGFHGCRGRRLGLDAQCSEILDFELSEDHGSNMEPMQKRNLRKKIMTGFQKRKKMSQHFAGKKLDADIVGHHQPSEVNLAGALWFSYGVGMGVMFTGASRKCEIDKVTSLLNQTVIMVQELKIQLDEIKDYLQNSEMPKGCHGEIYTYQQEKPGAAANWMLEKDPESICSYFKDNETASTVIIGEPAQQVTGTVELETEFQVGLDYIQMDFLQSNSSHQKQRTEYSESTDSSDVADEGLYANGLPGQWSSANMTPFVPSENFHMDDYGVSPYELDRRLCELLEKQREETISELEGELKSTENELHDKEIELQHWKEHVSRLLELSFVTDSGDESASLDSVSFERTNNADSKRQHTRHVL